MSEVFKSLDEIRQKLLDSSLTEQEKFHFRWMLNELEKKVIICEV